MYGDAWIGRRIPVCYQHSGTCHSRLGGAIDVEIFQRNDADAALETKGAAIGVEQWRCDTHGTCLQLATSDAIAVEACLS